jgi:hypothetical protein
MHIFNVLAAVVAISLAGGPAVAKDKPAGSKPKKACQLVEPAVGRIPAKRICTVQSEAPTVAAKAKGAQAQAAPAPGGRD